MKKVFWAAGFIGLLVCFCVMTGAQSIKTGAMYVQSEVPDEAWVSPQSLLFPTLEHSNWVSGSSVIFVKVGNGVPYHMTMNAGQYYSGSAPRHMRHSEDISDVGYYLFQDSAYTTQWGDNSYEDTYVDGTAMALTGTGAEQTIDVYAQAMPYGNAAPGNYYDMVVVTVHY